MVGTEGTDWKRHRAVAKPAFNEANNTLVWSETIRIVNEWMSFLESEQPDVKNSTIIVDVLPALTQDMPSPSAVQ
ncbi:hypothetical protein PILCRDRAFT_136461 [Piloderma croceum F 1598]|uniref:Cytochrome P450 n=1 Tax=Piloderma croceum (strain F 1598) TaxID=765440 RepID=A0A0C3CPS8_PILCF|nr:hypothetical protein PILCRDRAFT_136461 [Piloderma croceum F 1598]